MSGLSLHPVLMGFEIVALLLVCVMFIGMRLWDTHAPERLMQRRGRRWLRAAESLLAENGRLADEDSRIELEQTQAGPAVRIRLPLHSELLAPLRIIRTDLTPGRRDLNGLDGPLTGDTAFDALWAVERVPDEKWVLALSDPLRAVLVTHAPPSGDWVIADGEVTCRQYLHVSSAQVPRKALQQLESLVLELERVAEQTPADPHHALEIAARVDGSELVRRIAARALPRATLQTPNPTWLRTLSDETVLRHVLYRRGTPLKLRVLAAGRCCHSGGLRATVRDATWLAAALAVPGVEQQAQTLDIEERQFLCAAMAEFLSRPRGDAADDVAITAQGIASLLAALFDGAPEALEPSAHRLLEVELPPAATDAIIAALARIGTQASVPVLTSLALSNTNPARLRERAALAREQIRGRLQGAVADPRLAAPESTSRAPELQSLADSPPPY